MIINNIQLNDDFTKAALYIALTNVFYKNIDRWYRYDRRVSGFVYDYANKIGDSYYKI